jgi:hypothetical protein
MAPAVNNDVARTAALIAVAVLPAAAGLTGTAYLHPARFSAGFGTASLISAGLCLAGGALAHSPSATPARRPARHRSGGTAHRHVTLEPLARSRTEPPPATRHRRNDR